MWGRFVYDNPVHESDAKALGEEMSNQFGKINTTLAVHGEVMRRVEEQVKKTNGTVAAIKEWKIGHEAELKMLKWLGGLLATAVIGVIGYLSRGIFGL